jgi:hypothetical protein
MLRLLLNLWLYPVLGMMFAAGAGVLDGVSGGEGGTGGEGSGGAGEPGSGSGDGEREGGEGASREEGEGAEVLDGEGEGDGSGDGNQLVDSGDGRKIPAKYKELFETDKALRADYFNQRALQKVYPGGVKEAIQLKKAVEEFGGVEAVEQLQSDLETYHSDAEAFNKADPKWVEQGFEENPDAALKLFSHSLDYVGEHHPEQYDHLMAKVIKNDLDTGLPVRDLHKFLAELRDKDGKPVAEAQQLASALAKYYNHRDKLARQVPEKQIDPQQKKLDQRNAEITQKAEQIRNKEINMQASPYLESGLTSKVDQLAKERGFDVAKIREQQPGRYAKFVQDVKNSIFASVRGDAGWLDRYSKALSSNDTAKAVRMLNARHDAAIQGTEKSKSVVDQVFSDWFVGPKSGNRNGNANRGQDQNRARAGTGGNRGTGSETPVLVNSLPPAKDINYHDPKTDKWEGIYRLKSGKLIQVKRP